MLLQLFGKALLNTLTIHYYEVIEGLITPDRINVYTSTELLCREDICIILLIHLMVSNMLDHRTGLPFIDDFAGTDDELFGIRAIHAEGLRLDAL